MSSVPDASIPNAQAPPQAIQNPICLPRSSNVPDSHAASPVEAAAMSHPQDGMMNDQPAPLRDDISVDAIDSNLSPSQPPTLSNLRIAQAEWSKFFLHQTTNSTRAGDHRSIHLSVENQRTNQPWGDELDENRITSHGYIP